MLWEDSILERKVESDLKDIKKTLVGFANSVKPGHVATLLIGEYNDGKIQGVANPDNIQKTIRKICDDIYPPILSKMSVYHKDEKACVRIDIEYSGETPHFSGKAWIRKGSETIPASEEVFQKLIEIRSSKVREVLKWTDKYVIVRRDPATDPKPYEVGGITHYLTHPRWPIGINKVKVTDVNQFWVTLESPEIETIQGYALGEVRFVENGILRKVSEPLSKITLNYNNDNDCLELIISY